MRRGGGSRGGGFRGGGGRSFGSSRSRSSYSRRHYRRHHYGYYGGYYGRGGYYGGGYYGRPARPLGPLGSTIILFFVFGFLLFFVAGSLGTVQTNEYYVDPNGTIAIEVDSSFRNKLTLDMKDGIIDSYMFDTEPPLSNTVASTVKLEGLPLPSDWYDSFDVYLNKGSTVDVSFKAGTSITLYVIEGTTDYNSWVQGNDVYDFQRYGNDESFTYNVDKGDQIYFVFYNEGITTTVDVTFDISLKTHDLSNPVEVISGDYDSKAITTKYVILHNPSNTDPATVSLVLHPTYSFGTIYMILFVILSVLLVMNYNRMDKKHKIMMANYKKQEAAAVQTGAQQPAPVQSVFSKPASSGYYQRPTPTYCAECGSGLLPNSKFCNTCGNKT